MPPCLLMYFYVYVCMLCFHVHGYVCVCVLSFFRFCVSCITGGVFPYSSGGSMARGGLCAAAALFGCRALCLSRRFASKRQLRAKQVAGHVVVQVCFVCVFPLASCLPRFRSAPRTAA